MLRAPEALLSRAAVVRPATGPLECPFLLGFPPPHCGDVLGRHVVLRGILPGISGIGGGSGPCSWQEIIWVLRVGSGLNWPTSNANLVHPVGSHISIKTSP